jgi:hypothetical protein
MMLFNAYKNISDVIQAFPVHYQEMDFIQELPFVINDSFLQRLELILREGVVFNSEYAICENIISPILIEVWQSYKEQLLVWSHQPLNYDEQLSGIPDYMVAKRSAKGKIVFEEPYLIVVEAKKDNFEEGWGQCLAEMITAQKLNKNTKTEIFGIVSNGKFWEFGRLLGNGFEKNIKLYSISDLKELFSAINYVFQKSQSYCLQSA